MTRHTARHPSPMLCAALTLGALTTALRLTTSQPRPLSQGSRPPDLSTSEISTGSARLPGPISSPTPRAAAGGTPAPAPAHVPRRLGVTPTSTTSQETTHPGQVKPRASTKGYPSSGTFTGPSVATYYGYGPVQVQIVISGGRISDIKALKLPDESPRSKAISQYSEPQLRQEALDAQSSHIDTVSGATDTSDSYRTSLQAAIDLWHASGS